MATSPDTVISSIMANAATMRTEASAALDAAVATITPPQDFNPEPYAYTGWQGYQVGVGAVPTFAGEHYIAPQKTFGTAPSVEPVPLSEFGAVPVLSAQNPGFTSPTDPAELETFNVPDPVTNDITIPTMPSALESIDVTPPTLSTIVVPTAPSVTLPEFTAEVPDTNIAAPTDFATQYAANYNTMSVAMRNSLNDALDAELVKLNPEYHTQMALLESKLATYINGGTALTEEVEQAIYNRARDKTNAEYLKSRDMIFVEGAARGFTIPSGAQMSSLANARQAAADNNARAAMDIAIKQAEMEQNNIQFAMTQSANLRAAILGTVMSWMGGMIQLNGQSMEYARDVMQAAIALYETMVKIVTARIEVYKAQAQVYEIELKSVLAVYDVYQAQIKALEAQVNIDRAKVDAFSAQMSAYGALANAYHAAIQGAAAAAQIERLKVDIYEAKVRTFGAKVASKQAEWQAFESKVRGEIAKMSAYETEVRAYSAEVQGFESSVQAYKTQVEAVSTKNEAAYKVFTAAVQAYVAEVQGASESSKAEITQFEATLGAYKAEQEAWQGANRINLESMLGEQRLAQAQYAMNADVVRGAATAYSSYTLQAASAMTQAAGVYGNMAGSAMAGVNGLAASVATSAA